MFMKIYFGFILLFVLTTGQCLIKECFNGGKCDQTKGYCICPPGFKGLDCSLKDCGGKNCHFVGGKCEPGALCFCNISWLGINCAYRVCGGIPCFEVGVMILFLNFRVNVQQENVNVEGDLLLETLQT